MDKEYIEREAALEATTYNPLVEPNPTDIIYLTLITAQKNIRKIPAADVAPVVHGEWILEREPNGKPYCFHCSACDGDFHYIGITVKYDYCPNCGAKMDGGAIR